jgi:serine protease
MKKLLLLGLFVAGLWFALANFTGLATQGTYDSIVLDFREDIGTAQIENQVRAIAQQYKVTPQFNSAFSFADHIFIVKGDQKLLNSLRKSELRKYTEFIEPDYIYRVSVAPNDALYGKQWNLRSINVESAWDDTKGAGVTVAVIDTGISPVEDLSTKKFVKGYDFVNDRIEALDDNGHGTHVAGTIAQDTNNTKGVAGIAYEANLMPLKVLSAQGGGTVADISEAIRFAADNGADVINMSLGGGGESQLMQEAIEHAHSKGVVIVAAAGNSDSNAADYPARYRHVIGVSALGATGTKAPYSNFGAEVDISAPGGDTSLGEGGGILQNTIDPENPTNLALYEPFQGTSMAAPHVAGVAALVRASGITDPDQVEDVLKQSALPVKDDSLNHYGAGKLDAAAAVKLAARGQISFRDFFRWLRDNGYLNPRFWIDGGVIALWPKVLMVLGSYLLAWFLRNFFPFNWSWSLSTGLVAGSSGLFFLKGFYLFDAPQYPFRILGSSVPELASSVQGTIALNPIFANVLVPLGLLALLLNHPQWKWLAVGTTLGMAACFAVSAVMMPEMMWLGDGVIARSFLAINALLCFGLARLAIKPEVTT